ncbi:MAG TPA: hypothetical protein VFZ59_07665 [Verrucomicrobiae bacterium]|nr:hypothetical protein [Verrucomicrobiae bacterium]
MNDDFEKRLQQVTPRQVPSGWRQEILAAAKQAETPRETSVLARPNWLAALMDQLAVLLRPQRAAWAALATLWIVIMLLNRSGDSDATTAMTASIPAAQARMALQQKQFLMVELAGHTDLRAAAQPQAVSPGPRSQRREGAAAA